MKKKPLKWDHYHPQAWELVAGPGLSVGVRQYEGTFRASIGATGSERDRVGKFPTLEEAQAAALEALRQRLEAALETINQAHPDWA